MSVTTAMTKTPGARQHNRGWMTLHRQGLRDEAVARQRAYLVEHPWSTPVSDMQLRITRELDDTLILTGNEVEQLETSLDAPAEVIPQLRTRTRRGKRADA
jgi:hypothetical protein